MMTRRCCVLLSSTYSTDTEYSTSISMHQVLLVWHRVQYINQHASSAAGMVPLLPLFDGAVWCRIH